MEGNKVKDYFPPVHTFLINKLIEKKSYYFHQGGFNLLVLSFLSIETLIKSTGLPTPFPFPPLAI